MSSLEQLRAPVRTYGPLVGFVSALALLAVVIPATDDAGGLDSSESTPVAAGDTVGGDAGLTTDPSAPTVTGGAGGDASAGGSDASGGDPSADVPNGAVAGGAGAGCRSEDGRQAGISRYMPPCVEVYRGDNGGETARGVQRDKVIVVRYVNYGDAATRAAASALSTNLVPSKEDYDREAAGLLRYFNLHYETYGREVVAVTVEATGTDDQSARADAIKIAQEIGAFAVFPGTGGADTPAFVDELAARRVFCIGCTLGYPKSFYERTEGYVFASLPPVEEVYGHLAEYIGKRLARKPATWAGDPTLQAATRKLGLLWIHNTFPGGGPPDPGNRQARDHLVAELGRYGVSLTRDVGYLYDVPRLQEQATNIIVQMKSAGVTSLATYADPISLTVFTREATKQAYFPEWIVAGGMGSESTIWGRLYDQAQWRHAFGVSAGWVSPTTASSLPGYREHHHAEPEAPADEGNKATIVLHPALELLFTGIHMAGPDLTVQSFQQGMYRYPNTGGLSVAPLRFFRPDSPMALKDFVEVFYDAERSGTDELGNQGVGVLVFADGAQRRDLGEWPASEPKVFVHEGTVTSSDDPPTGLPHEQDGHRHPPGQRCRSCDG